MTAYGESLPEAEARAKKLILERGLGSYVKSQDIILDAQLKDSILTSSASGYVFDFQVLDKLESDGVWEIRAFGKVDARALGDAFQERYKDIGKPRLMMVFEERLADEASPPGRSLTENALAGKWKEFEFVDKAQLERILAHEGLAGSYDNPGREKRVLSLAAEMNAEILVLGRTEVRVGKSIVENLHPMHATVSVRIVDVGSARVLASENGIGTYPHIDKRQGAKLAIYRAVDDIADILLKQIETKLRSGRTIRVVFESIDYDDFVDRDILRLVRNLPLVNEVRDRGPSVGSGLVELEVVAFTDGATLYRHLRSLQDDLGLRFKASEVRNNRVHVVVSVR